MPDPLFQLGFHSSLLFQFTSARPEEKEIIFETSSVYQNEPIQVTDPPVFRRDRELEFPTQSESFEPVHSPQFYRKSTQNAIFDPVSKYFSFGFQSKF